MNLLNRFAAFFSRRRDAHRERKYVGPSILIISTSHDKLSKMVAFPIAIFIVCLRPLIQIRFIPLSCYTIGHYSLWTEVLLCKLDQDKNKSKVIYLHGPKSKVCNKQLYAMWHRVISILPYSCYTIFKHVEIFLEKWLGKDPYKTLLGKASHDRWDVLETGKSHLAFTKEEQIKGQRILENMGIPANGKFICLIVLDESYYLNNTSYTQLSGFRNADISQYKKSALYLAENGYYVLRMGKRVNQTFGVDHPHVIDYANSVFRSDFMDVYLTANCYFFMSTLCGLDGIAHAFRRPILATDITPNGYYCLGYPVKLFLTKKIINKNTGQILSF